MVRFLTDVDQPKLHRVICHSITLDIRMCNRYVEEECAKYICPKSCSVLAAFNAPCISSLHTMGSQWEFPIHEAPGTAATWVGETNAGLSPGPGPQ